MASKWHGWFEAVPVGKALTRDSCHTGTQMALLMSTAISTCECIVTQSATRPTLWEGRVCKPTHCRAFEVSQLCCLSCWRCFLPWPIGFLWHQDPLGPEGQHSGVLFHKCAFSHSIAHLSCAAHFLGKTLSLVLVRWPCTNPSDEKDSLGE